MTKLKAGLIGHGVMGRNHARVLSELDGVEFVGATDPRGSSGASTYPVYHTLHELLALAPDYCIVAVPTSLHLEVALMLAESGVHALIEKPLAPTVQEAEAIVKAFDSAGLIGGVGHVERYNAAVQEARRRIHDGQLGDIFLVSTSRQGPFPGRLYDVGVGLDLATHDIDLTTWIVDSAFVEVSAAVRKIREHHHEDLLTMMGTLESGPATSHVINWLSPCKDRHVCVIGERGMFRIDTLTSDLTFFENGSIPNEWGHMAQFRGISQGDVTRYAFVKKEPLVVEHECFRDAILGQGRNIVSLASATHVVSVANAALASASDGLPRRLSEDS